MRIGCLQFAPQLGDVDNNLNRADAVLSRVNPQDLDLLVLPELAFTGFNFKSLEHITPYLEPTASGITSLWVRTVALKYECVVAAGYPEKVDVSPKWPTSPEYYNSMIVVNADGETVANYRKSFLYPTDETWALESPDGFFDGEIDGLGNVAIGICMDIKFEAPWNAWEFAYHVLDKQSNLIIISMAWLTREDSRAFSRAPLSPDMETLSYWLARLEPVIRAETDEEIIAVFVNRCGSEDNATYAGTSCVLGIRRGEVTLYGVLGRGEKNLLVVDTSQRPQAKLVTERPARKEPTPAKQTEEPKPTQSEKPRKDIIPIPPPAPGETRMSRANASEARNRGDEIVVVMTPIEPQSPQGFFSTGGTQYPDAPFTPGFRRPDSPKSRNCSRAGHREAKEPALQSHDLATEEIQRRQGTPLQGSHWSTDMALNRHQRDGGLGAREGHSIRRPRSSVW